MFQRRNKRFKQTFFVLAVILLLCFDAVYSRRGGGRFRFRSRSGYRSYSRPKRPHGHFGKGGMETFGKVMLASYLAKKMKPSVGYHGHSSYSKYHRPTFCQDCVSVNGSNPACEKGFSEGDMMMKVCHYTRSRPYCSTEYGITSDDLHFVRRSCNERRCNTCSHHLSKATNSTKKCYTIQCDMCNWDGCNSKSAAETFHDKWTGCIIDNADHRLTFTADDTCTGCSLSKNMLLVIVTGFAAHVMAKS